MLKKKLGAEGIGRDWCWSSNLENYFKIPTTLIIPESCEVIGITAFGGCERLEKVEIPESVKYIKGAAFYRCEKLEEVIIPESVERIGYEAFWGCKKANIILRKRREAFWGGVDAFKNCKDVKEEIRS